MSELPENCALCDFYNMEACQHNCAKDVETKITRLPELCPMKEDVLDAKRFRVTYREENIYLIIGIREGTPWEVFVKYDPLTDRKDSLQYMLASWVCVTRFVTMALKRYPVKKVVSQLRKSSRLKDDLPAIIAGKLEEWV